MTKVLITLSFLFLLISCENKDSMNSSSTNKKVQNVNIEDEAPCDDPEAAKVEISDEDINLLDEEEGCKLPE